MLVLASPMDVDRAELAGVRVYGVVVQMPEGHGVAGVGPTPTGAWGALPPGSAASPRRRGCCCPRLVEPSSSVPYGQ